MRRCGRPAPASRPRTAVGPPPKQDDGPTFLGTPTPRRTGKSWQTLYRVATCFLPYTRSINAVSPCICTRTVLPSRMVNTSAS
jgi:hypothetical protein